MRKYTSFGLIGCGAMGTSIAQAFDSGQIQGKLIGLFDINTANAVALADKLKSKPRVVDSASELIEKPEFVIEAASQDAVKGYAVEAVSKGKSILIMSVGALLEEDTLDRLRKAADKTGASIYLPSGALAGVDGLLAAASDEIEEVTLTTTKPPTGLAGVQYLKEQGIDVDSLTTPTVVYEGDAKDAVKLFPKNINVSAIMAIAVGGEVKVRIVADPNVQKNMHEIVVRGSFGELTSKTSNVPSPTNPKTSYLAVLAAIATLKKIVGDVKIGT